MKIKRTLQKDISIDGKEFNYYYRITEKSISCGQVYGIEVERQDSINGEIINLERNSIDVVSNEENKINEIIMILFNNIVSPIHLVDIVGEYADQFAEMAS